MIPTSFFEADGPHHYNSLAMIGPDGDVQGVYRKSHIPDGPGYEEKFYFRPGNTGFKVWDGPRSRDAGRRHLLGPMVSRNRAGDDADGRATAVLSDRDRQRAARHRARHRAAVAARDGRPCGVERRAGGRRQSRRRGTWPDLLRHQLHHRRARRHPGRTRTARRRASSPRRSTSTASSATARRSASSATAGRSSTGGWWRTSRRLPQPPARKQRRTSLASGGRCSGCSASNGSYRSGCGRRA